MATFPPVATLIEVNRANVRHRVEFKTGLGLSSTLRFGAYFMRHWSFEEERWQAAPRSLTLEFWAIALRMQRFFQQVTIQISLESSRTKEPRKASENPASATVY